MDEGWSWHSPGTTVDYLAPLANQPDLALAMIMEAGNGGCKFQGDMILQVH